MRVLIIGDTHGNADWLRRYIFPVAMTTQADAVVVLGDFGAWEHIPAGVAFMDEVGDLCMTSGIPLYWLAGNHDKRSHTEATYAFDARGFQVCREFVFYIPNGHAWSWGGVRLRSFAGAYSVDKAWRIEKEHENYQKLLRQADYRRQATGVKTVVPAQTGTLWFPEEEMTDADMTALLEADSGAKDIILSHDKPYSAKPPWNRKNIPGCLANQLRLEMALRAHRPSWWLHGHLHYHYQDQVFGGDWAATIVGLEPDDEAAEPGWKRANTWALAELTSGKVKMKIGHETFLDTDQLQKHIATLG